VRRVAGNVFIDWRWRTELTVAVVLVSAFVWTTREACFPTVMDEDTRGSLYASLAGTAGALLGFVLAALAILVALPSTERLEALRRHPRWERVPSAYFRAARALLVALILTTLGIALDGAGKPWLPYEVVTVVAVAAALVRVAASVAALDQILAVARAEPEVRPRINDPGP